MILIKVNSRVPELDLLQQAADILLADGIIGYPTETVYGLGANAFSSAAITKIFQLKQRDHSKPILIIAADFHQVETCVAEVPELARQLAQSFWPGPLTIIFKAAPHLTRRLLGDGDSIGIRIPANTICLELLRICGVPLTSTSANLAGAENPISAADVRKNFGQQLDMIIDGGAASDHRPSTVIDLSGDKPVLVREGKIVRQTIEQTMGITIDEKK